MTRIFFIMTIMLTLMGFMSANVFATTQTMPISSILKSSQNITLDWKIDNSNIVVSFPNATSAPIKILVSIDSTSDRVRVRCGNFNGSLSPSSSILCELAPNYTLLLDIYSWDYKNGASGKYILMSDAK